MSRRHRYRKPRFRGFKPAWSARAPRLMLVLGLMLSVAVHLGLGMALKDQTFGSYDPAAFEEDTTPVRVKRAKFDQIVSPQAGEGQGEGESEPTAAELAAALMEEVDTATAEPFDPELELREAPEPTREPMAQAPPPSSDTLGLDELLAGFIDEPEQPEFVDQSRFDAARAGTADGGALGADLLDQLTAADGGLPGGGGTGDGWGPGMQGVPGGRAGGGADVGYGPGSGRGGDGGSGTASNGLTSGGGGGGGGGPSSGGGGLDFLGIGGIEPADFEPPERLDNDFDYRVTRFDGNPAAHAAAGRREPAGRLFPGAGHRQAVAAQARHDAQGRGVHGRHLAQHPRPHDPADR